MQSTSVGPLPGNWLAACLADLTPDLQVCLSWRSKAESFHSLRSLSVSCFHVILGLPGPCFPSTYRSKAVLTAPLEHCTHVHISLVFSPSEWGPDPQCQASQVHVAHWIWWWQYLAAWHCRSVWSLPCHSAADAGGLALSMAKSHWHGALRSTPKSCTCGHVSWKRCQEDTTGSRSLDYFQTVFTHVVVESSQPVSAESMSPR